MIKNISNQLVVIKGSIVKGFSFIVKNWLILGIIGGGINFSYYMVSPRLDSLATGYLHELLRPEFKASEDRINYRADSLNVIKEVHDSNRTAEFKVHIDTSFTNQNIQLDSVSRTAARAEIQSILSDTIPYYENGREAGYYLMFIMPNGTPIVNKYNSIFFNPNSP